MLLGGAVFDWKQYRVPNWWLLTGLAAGIGLEMISAGGAFYAAAGFLARSVLVIMMFFVLFCFRMMGAGDIKLMALMCSYLGMGDGLRSLAWSFLFGAFWSLFRLIRLNILFKRLLYFIAYIRQVFTSGEVTGYYDPETDGYDGVIPFALCLFSGTVFYTILLPLIE